MKRFAKLRRLRADARALWDESALQSETELSKLQKWAHFCVMVWRSFTRNRCPVRASALAYATLLALIPMLAVGDFVDRLLHGLAAFGRQPA